MRSCKCKICGKTLNTETAYCKITFGTKSGKERKKYYCSEKEFLDYYLIEMNESLQWESLYEYVKYEVFEYDQRQTLPRSLITKLRDLRNGVDYIKGRGRVVGEKNGYPYEVITETFENNLDTIHYCMDTKDFKNENAKVNYVMAIISNTINDTYEKWILNKKRIELEQKKHDLIGNENMNLDKVMFDNKANVECKQIDDKSNKTNNETKDKANIGDMLSDIFG